MRHLYTLFGSLILLFALFFFTKNQYTYQSYPLNWDEVDYVNATKLGVLTNAFEIEGMDLSHGTIFLPMHRVDTAK